MNQLYLQQLLLVGAGGFIGSSLRFALAGLVQRSLGASMFPWGTLSVNVIGCLLIGLLGGLAAERGLLQPAVRLFLMVGILGGFTTFSSFALETLALARGAQLFSALANIAAQVVLGLLAAWVGLVMSRLMG